MNKLSVIIEKGAQGQEWTIRGCNSLDVNAFDYCIYNGNIFKVNLLAKNTNDG